MFRLNPSSHAVATHIYPYSNQAGDPHKHYRERCKALGQDPTKTCTTRNGYRSSPNLLDPREVLEGSMYPPLGRALMAAGSMVCFSNHLIHCAPPHPSKSKSGFSQDIINRLCGTPRVVLFMSIHKKNKKSSEYNTMDQVKPIALLFSKQLITSHIVHIRFCRIMRSKI